MNFFNNKNIRLMTNIVRVKKSNTIHNFKVDGGSFNVYYWENGEKYLLNRNYKKYADVKIEIKKIDKKFVISDVNAKFESVVINKSGYIYVEGCNGSFRTILKDKLDVSKALVDNKIHKQNQKQLNSDEIYENIYLFEEIFSKENVDMQAAWLISRFRIFHKLSYMFNIRQNDLQIFLYKQFYFKPNKKEEVDIQNLEIKKVDNLIFLHDRFVDKCNVRLEPFRNISNSADIFPTSVNSNLNSIILEKIRNSFIDSYSFKEDKITKIKEIESEFFNIFGILLPLNFMFNDALAFYEVEKKVYEELFSKTRAKKIIYLAAYNNIALTYVAKSKNILCLEYQYSAIVKNHFAYRINFKVHENLIPDYFLSWGTYWNKVYRIKGPRIKEVGFDFVTNQIDIKKVKTKKLVFISQPTICALIEKNIEKICDVFSEYEIVLRLHPREKEFFSTNYPKAFDLMNAKRVVLSTEEMESIGTCLSSSKIVIGSYSTAIYEARAMNCSIFIFKDRMSKYIEDLVAEFDNVVYFKSVKKMKNAIEDVENGEKILMPMDRDEISKLLN